MGTDNLDVRGIIEGSSKATTVSALRAKGINRVRLIDEKQIHELILLAVQRIVVSRADLMTEQEREKIFKAARAELGRLVQEQGDMKEAAARDREALAEEVQNLQRQLKLTRDLADEESRRKYEDLVATQQAQLREAQIRIEALTSHIASLRHDPAPAPRETMSLDLLRRLDALERRLEAPQRSPEELTALRDSLGGIARKLDMIKMKVSPDEVAYRPGAVTLGDLMSQNVESNIDRVGVSKESGQSVDEAMKRLRGLRQKS